MPIFLLISRHSPENCDMFNEKSRKVTLELMGKMEELLKKHGVKLLGGWIVTTEHLGVYAFEAPSFEAFQKLGNEPEVLATSAFETYEIKPAISFEEAVQMLQQAT